MLFGTWPMATAADANYFSTSEWHQQLNVHYNVKILNTQYEQNVH